MKKIKWLLCISFIFLAVLSSGFTVKAENEFNYRENDDGTITITGYTGTDETVVIPSEIDGKNVNIIGEEAFYEHKDLKNVTIPEGVTTIESRSFYCCKNLENVSFPNTLKTIGNYAFYECSKLNHVDLPNGLSSIEDGAFGSCSITKIIIPDSVTYIGNFETFFISHFTVVTIYANLNSYAREYADKMSGFAIEFSCINHVNIVIDPAVAPTCKEYGKTEGSHCADCESIITESKSIKPNGHKIITVDKKATCTESSEHYTYCEVCGKRNIDEDGNHVPPSSATGGTGHKYGKGVVTVQPSCLSTGIKTYTCTVCGETRTEKIPKISIPRNGKTISDSSNSYKVTKSVKSVKKNVTGTVEYVGTNTSKTSITIPNTVTIDGITYKVTSIAKNAFKNNKKLKNVTIGSNITSINVSAFNGCKNLKTIIIKSKNINFVGKNAFKGINAKAKIKVPSSELTKYKKLFAGKGQKSSIKIKK